MANKVARKKNKCKKKLRGEFAIYLTLFLILLAIPVCNVYTKAILSSTNIELEEKKNDIKDQEEINESLKMEISELTSLDTIQEIAKTNSLTYQDGNIKVVTNE